MQQSNCHRLLAQPRAHDNIATTPAAEVAGRAEEHQSQSSYRPIQQQWQTVPSNNNGSRSRRESNNTSLHNLKAAIPHPEMMANDT